MTTTIVIPVRNALPYLKECIASVKENTKEYQFIFVNDASDEETSAYLWQQHKENAGSFLIINHKQQWFSRASNVGLRMVNTDFAVLLNSDTVCHPGWLEELYGVLEEYQDVRPDRNVAVVGSVHTPGAEQRWTETREPNYVTGHCWLLNMNAAHSAAGIFNRPGCFFNERDQQQIHINSDRIFCYELNRLGYTTLISFHSAVTHTNGGGKSWDHDLSKIFGIKLSDLD